MKTIKFDVCLSIGYQVKRTDTLEVEVEDNATEEQIEEAKDYEAREWAANYIEISYD